MIRRPPRSTLSSSSAASDVYKRQERVGHQDLRVVTRGGSGRRLPVSYTHLRAHETPEHLVCRLLLEKKKNNNTPKACKRAQANPKNKSNNKHRKRTKQK